MRSGFENSTNSRSSLSSSSNNNNNNFDGNERKLGLDESMKSESSSNNNNNNNEGGDFECNICFELAQDPIVTLCGHLFCWPCLYKWLRFHSQSQECPVCKALIQEDKLVPLYGRGKSTSDPRSRPVPGLNIPNRPSGQRPETAPPPQGGPAQDQNYFSNFGGGLFGGFMPMASTRFGNVTMSAGFGGLLPSLFSFQFNGFPHNAMYGTAHGFPYGYGHGNGYGHGHGYGHRFYHHGHHNHHRGGSQGQDNFLMNLMLVVAVFVLAALVWS